MKKLCAILLLLATMFTLASCLVLPDSDVDDEIIEDRDEDDTDGDDTDGDDTDGDDINGDDNNENSDTEEDEHPSGAKVTIEQTVLLDEGGVKITAKSIDTNGLFGAEIKLLIENNSGKDLTVQCRHASVNGYMVGTMMSVDVVNGKKANDELTFMASDLESCGITAIADMEFSFHIFTTEDWKDYLDSPLIRLKTSIADTYQYTFDDSGDIAYNANGIKVIIKGLAENSSLLGPSIVVYIENNTDKEFTVQNRNVSINGFMVGSIFSCDVMPGKKAVDTITFMDSDLEENEITNIENVELSFHIFDTESWDGLVDTDVVKITF